MEGDSAKKKREMAQDHSVRPKGIPYYIASGTLKPDAQCVRKEERRTWPTTRKGHQETAKPTSARTGHPRFGGGLKQKITVWYGGGGGRLWCRLKREGL